MKKHCNSLNLKCIFEIALWKTLNKNLANVPRYDNRVLLETLKWIFK